MEDIWGMKSCNSYRHVIQCNLKGPGADKLGLNGCAREGYKGRTWKIRKEATIEKEEGHHAGVDLVVKQPLGPAWGGLTHTGKRVKAGTSKMNRYIICLDHLYLAKTIIMTRNLMTLRIWAAWSLKPPGGKLSPRIERSGYFCCSIPAYCWNTCSISNITSGLKSPKFELQIVLGVESANAIYLHCRWTEMTLKISDYLLCVYCIICLLHLLVSSGIAVEEFDGGTHHLRHLRSRNVLLGSGFCKSEVYLWGGGRVI